MKESGSNSGDAQSNPTAPIAQIAANEASTFPDADPRNCLLATLFFAAASKRNTVDMLSPILSCYGFRCEVDNTYSIFWSRNARQDIAHCLDHRLKIK